MAYLLLSDWGFQLGPYRYHHDEEIYPPPARHGRRESTGAPGMVVGRMGAFALFEWEKNVGTLPEEVVSENC